MRKNYTMQKKFNILRTQLTIFLDETPINKSFS